MNRVRSWSSHDDADDERNSTSEKYQTDPPAVIRLNSAGPPSVQKRAGDAAIYLTRANPLTFMSSVDDARRLASTSRWLTIEAVGVEEIREEFGDEADRLIPSSFEARSDIDETAAEAADEGDTAEYTRAQLEAMEWDEIRSIAVDSPRDDIDGRTSREDIVDALSADGPEK